MHRQFADRATHTTLHQYSNLTFITETFLDLTSIYTHVNVHTIFAESAKNDRHFLNV